MNCKTERILYLAWKMAAPDIKAAKLAQLEAHRKTCAICGGAK